MPDYRKFSWVQTHKELVRYLRNMKVRQPELIFSVKKKSAEGFTGHGA